MPTVELTCMCMILDRANHKVLVQDRQKSWPGINFPGGHVEPGEGLVAAAIREAKEETGLTVSNLKPCGIIHFYNDITGDRYMVFNFKTETFSGELISDTPEGKVFWVDIDELSNLNFARGFKERLPMFLEDKFVEGFEIWNEGTRNTVMQWY